MRVLLEIQVFLDGEPKKKFYNVFSFPGRISKNLFFLVAAGMIFFSIDYFKMPL